MSPTPIYQSLHEERAVPGGRRIVLEFHAGDAEGVPAVLLLPAAARAAPAALLIHGYSSHKEQMADTVGEALLQRGIASVAIDLPLHGEREATIEPLSVGHPFELARRWHDAITECALALNYLAVRSEIDRQRLALVGYSLGSFLGVIVAARAPLVRAVVLAAGGDLPSGTPFGKLVRSVADPLRAVRALHGRPLLMLNGKWDRTVRPEQAERLFAEAGEPKELRWWDAGHYLPPAAIADGAEWLAGVLSSTTREQMGEG